MSDCASKRLFTSLIFLLVTWGAAQAITATTGHYTYTISSTSMSVTVNGVGSCARRR